MKTDVDFFTVDRICGFLASYKNDLSQLVAIFSRQNGSHLRLVLNEPTVSLEISEHQIMTEIVTLEEAWQETPDWQYFDGVTAGFADLALLWPSLPMKSPLFYPIELLFKQWAIEDRLPLTRHTLACTLFDKLDVAEELPAHSSIQWLEIAGRLFNLTIPLVLSQNPTEGLLAIVPEKNLSQYLFGSQYQLIYAVDVQAQENTPLWLNSVDTRQQLCAAFVELADFVSGISDKHAGFFDLRKIIYRSPYAHHVTSTAHQLISILRKLELSQEVKNKGIAKLQAEQILRSVEVDGLVAVECVDSVSAEQTCLQIRLYYLTVPTQDYSTEPMQIPFWNEHQVILLSLDDLLLGKYSHSETKWIASFKSTSQFFDVDNEIAKSWFSLNEILLKLHKPDVIARSTYLLSHRLRQRVSKNFKEPVHEAALACTAFSLTNPWRWRQGNHVQKTRLAYDNFSVVLERLFSKVPEHQRFYYRALGEWWRLDLDEEPSEKRIRLELIVRDMKTGIEGLKTKTLLSFPDIQRFYILTRSFLALLDDATQPVRLRDDLLNAEFAWVSKNEVIRRRDIFATQDGPMQPSPLFLMALGRFLNRMEQSHQIRIGQLSDVETAVSLQGIGRELANEIGLNFDLLLQSADEGLDGIHPMARTSFRQGLWHERIWMEFLYIDAIRNLVQLVRTLKTPSLQGKITSTEFVEHTPYEIKLFVEPPQDDDELIDGLFVRLENSAHFDVLDNLPMKSVAGDKTAVFNLAFRHPGDIPLRFTYFQNGQETIDEIWVHVLARYSDAFTELENPYPYGHIIQEPAVFYGRHDELAIILNGLRSAGKGQSQNFHVRGKRRSGKTSLLHMVRRIIKEPKVRRHFQIDTKWDESLDRWHAVYYSVQESPELERTGKLDSFPFFKTLVQRTCQELAINTQETASILEQMDTHLLIGQDIVGATKSAFRGILQHIGDDRKILILLDETNLLLSEKSNARLFGHLRSIIIAIELVQVTWILTSTQGLYDADDAFESPLFNILRTVPLRPLAADEARRQVLEPAEEVGVRFLPEAVDTLVIQTGRHPFLLQIACSQTIAHLNDRRLTHVSQSTVQAALNKVYARANVFETSAENEDAKSLFDYLWRPTLGVGQLFLVVLLRAQESLTSQNGRFQQIVPEEKMRKWFWKTWEDEKLTKFGVPSAAFAKGRNHLLDDDLVYQTRTGYQFVIPLFQQWLQQRPTLELLEEAVAKIKEGE